ncbi:NUDIX domain-containing protein [Nocardioides yefusunii]|uniref:NUDIX domain-containing protein n=1 Tax=Nocardioides yefusunii TaxID=2500546 RepID=A0ABW1QUS0_9ACTN|nr:NUDIX domain-containing protein [Nocardioides yefusunii]
MTPVKKSPRMSAGLLMHRVSSAAGRLEVLLVHPGGPFWARKDAGAWSIPKGEWEPDDGDLRSVAVREFVEEIGVAPPVGELAALGEVRQAGGKVVTAFALAGDVDLSGFRSNTFSMEWPPHSGVQQEFPEVDRAEWFSLEEARARLNPAQAEFLDRLLETRDDTPI